MSTCSHPPMATARIFSDTLSPEEVTRVAGLQPLTAARRGAALVQRTGRPPVIAKTGTWFVTTEGRVTDDDPGHHLTRLVTRLGPAMDRLRQSIPDARIEFSLLVHDPDFQVEGLPSAVLEAVTALGTLEVESPENGGSWLVPAGQWNRPGVEPAAAE